MLRQGVSLVGLGITIGTILALALTHVLSFMLAGVSAADPVTFAGAGAVLALVGFGASYLPVHQASRVDPLVALRSE